MRGNPNQQGPVVAAWAAITAFRLFGGLALVLAATSTAVGADAAPRTTSALLKDQASLTLRFNRELLSQLGLTLRDAGDRRVDDGTVTLTLDTAGTMLELQGASLHRWTQGEWAARGGFSLVDGKGHRVVDVRTPTLRPIGGTTRIALPGTESAGGLVIDSLMANITTDRRQLNVASLDLRLDARAAAQLGTHARDGLTLADGSGHFDLATRTEGGTSSCAVPHWPGADGGAYVADLQIDDITAQMMRCGEPGCSGSACTCDGPGGTDAAVVLAPRAELSNTADDNGGAPCTPQDPCSADIPWNAKFSPARAPYGNDQHPVLIWNLYRLDPDGTIAQIGRSGVKHAFVALNTGCDCADAQILGRGCGDVYATNNNDNNFAVGPRAEIVPAQARWARCGSLDDDEVVSPNPDFGGCDGVRDPSGNTVWSHRLAVRESQLDPASHPGSRYLFEAWYVVRDDVNIFNSMGVIEVAPSWDGLWNLPRVTGTTFRRGPALDDWTVATDDPLPPKTDTVTDARGTLRLVSRVHALPAGRWRYDYALMNFDFLEAQLSNDPANPRLHSATGLSGFQLALPAGVRVFGSRSDDGDLLAENDWVLTASTTTLRWDAQTGGRLGWGSLMRFTIVTDAKPVSSAFQTTVGAANGPVFTGWTPALRDADRLFADAFEPLFGAAAGAQRHTN